MVKYLSPWRKVVSHRDAEYHRYALAPNNSPYAGAYYSVSGRKHSGSIRWRAHGGELHSSLEKAQAATDQIAISKGWAILTEEEWEKYSVLV